MAAEPPVEFVEQQEWLEPVETALQQAVGGAFQKAGDTGRRVQNFLHGVWLGHPLHPVLTDVPLGAWTATAVLDCLDMAGRKDCRAGADVSLKVGLAGAAAAALAGLTDWHVTDGRARRVGVAHGLLNLVSTGLYLASLSARKSGRRGSGRWFAFAGYAVSASAAYLGGNLVYGKQIGVNHTGAQPGPREWTDVLGDRELEDASPRRAEVNGVKVLLVRRGSRIYCLAETCSHLGGPLAEGEFTHDTVKCPWHGSRFCLADGSVIDGPATHPQPAFETRVRQGRILIRAREQE